MMLVDGEVARTFSEVFGFSLFFVLRFVLENMSGTKLVVQALLFPATKKI